MSQLNVKPDFNYYFGLFLVKKDEQDEGSVKSILCSNILTKFAALI
jgi:hypothetical protein